MYNLFIRFLLPRGDPPSFVWKGEVPPTPPKKNTPFYFPCQRKHNIYFQVTVLYTEYVSNSFLFALYISLPWTQEQKKFYYY